MQRKKKNLMGDDHWKLLIFSDGCQVENVINNRVYVWRKSDEVHNNHFVSVNIVLCYGDVFVFLNVLGHLPALKAT